MMRRSKPKSRFAVAAIAGSIVLVCSVLQIVQNSNYLKGFIAVTVESSFSLLQETLKASSLSLDDTNATKSLQQDPENFASFKRLATTTSRQQQLVTFQNVPRRNTSRQLCGAILASSPKADRLPRIFSSSAAKSAAATTNDNKCAPNAILYMVQKGKHSSYNRNSTALFIRSLDLLYENYLSVNHHYKNVHVLIVHSGDYTKQDLEYLDRRYNQTLYLKLMDVSNTDYWTIPNSVRHDNLSQWAVYPQFSVGYRHMIRWYALKLYDFIRDYGQADEGCRYQYLMRMDEDSYIHSPITYDLFDFMQSNNYSYAFRMCAYELEVDVWEDYMDHLQQCGLSLPSGTPHRLVSEKLCAFYNNFFILDVDFILQPHVQHFLQWIDAVGVMYRERYNDLQIQAIAVYHFLPPERIHRFLDWTYEHMSYIPVEELQCPYWGAIQAGYLDSTTQINTTFLTFRKLSNMNRQRCPGIRRNFIFTQADLSPTYSHLPNASWWKETYGIDRDKFQWKTFAAGGVEGRSRGIFSG
jgi:alpha 1,2-mannosyltransferase